MIVDERARRARRTRERDEVGVGDGGGPRAVEGATRPRHAEVARLAAEADVPARGAGEGRADPEATRRRGLRLLDAVGGDVRGVVETREERLVSGHENLGLEDPGLAPDELERLLGRPGQVRRAHHRPPASLARLRIVGPPLPSFLICIGCPLPQFEIGYRWKSEPTASTFMR